MMRPEFLLLLALLLWAPLAFGTVEPWSRALLETTALVALAVAWRRRTHDGVLRVHRAPGTLPLLLFLGLILAQCVPLPPGLLQLVSPRAFALYQETLGAAAPLPWIPLSLDPLATLLEFFRFASLAACYLLTVQVLARRERLRSLVTVLAAFAAILSFLALLQSICAPARLLFLRTSPAGHPFGPFVNRNHYGNLAAMLFPLLLAPFLSSHPAGRARTLRERLAAALARTEGATRLLFGFAALLTGVSLVMSLSRGAIVSAGLALLLVGGLMPAGGPNRRRALAITLFSAAFAVFAGWFGWEHVMERFALARQYPEHMEPVRLMVWRDTEALVRAFPLVGSGMGGFAHVFPRFRSMAGTYAVDHPHNDYLELLAGGGAGALLLFAWFVAAVLRAVRGAFRERKEPTVRTLTLGAVAGIAAFLIHSLTDFNLAIGANSLYFFFLLGLAVSASHARGPEGAGRTRLPRENRPSWVTTVAVVIAGAALLVHAGSLAARGAYRLADRGDGETAALPRPPEQVRRLIALAAGIQPLEADYPAARARLAARAGRTGEAIDLTLGALRRRPTDSAILQQLGILLGVRGEVAQARGAFEAAVAFDPTNPLRRETYGSWLLARGERAAGIRRLREAIALDPQRAARIFALMVLAGLSDAEMAEAVPREAAALRQFAEYCEATGSTAPAREAYRTILALDPGNRQAAEGLQRLRNAPPVQ